MTGQPDDPAVAYHCDDCGITFTRGQPPRGHPFTVAGIPGIHLDRARGRAHHGLFIADASTCPQCGRLAPDTDLRAMFLDLRWTPPAPDVSAPDGKLER
jgi:predicted RNA-binding Zn-ribbon protein involved in translation (DUF1610 family)